MITCLNDDSQIMIGEFDAYGDRDIGVGNKDIRNMDYDSTNDCFVIG